MYMRRMLGWMNSLYFGGTSDISGDTSIKVQRSPTWRVEQLDVTNGKDFAAGGTLRMTLASVARLADAGLKTFETVYMPYEKTI